MKGEVIDVDTALLSPTNGSSGLGFPIPSRPPRSPFGVDELRLAEAGWTGITIEDGTGRQSEIRNGPGSAEGMNYSGIAMDCTAAV
jgi:S1-C subfamily serine protease